MGYTGIYLVTKHKHTRQRRHSNIRKRSRVHMTKYGDHLMVFTLKGGRGFTFSRTQTFIRTDQRRVPPSSPSNMPLSYGAARRCSSKGSGTRKEMQRMLNTKPMAPDTPHPSLSAPSNLLLLAIPPLNRRALQGVSYISWNYAKEPSDRAAV